MAKGVYILDSEVVIVGGGPFGLMLAIELGRRNVTTLLYDAKNGTVYNPQANATQARTMEYFRRLGIADEIRALGMPADYPTDIAYFTRYGHHELGRFQLPASSKANALVRSNQGSWTASEAPHRVSQKFVEPVLRRLAEAHDSVTINFGWRMTEFKEGASGVSAIFEQSETGVIHNIDANYLIGADGARSMVRKQLGYTLQGEYGKERHFLGGRMYAVYLRCPEFYEVVEKQPAWMNWTFNNDRRAFIAAVDGKGEFAFHTQLSSDEDEATITDERAADLFREACGVNIDCEVLSHMGWTAGHSLVADHFISDRVIIGGDAAHLFTPTGGLGYNTAVEDAVNLGWKLAAVLRGQGGRGLIESYEFERQKVAFRNAGYARGFADSVGNFVPEDNLEDNTEGGELLRTAAGEYLVEHAKREFNIPGITFGARYDGSPVLPKTDETLPQDQANFYQASGIPGGRPPHWWLNGDDSLFDHFGAEWTLLSFDEESEAKAAILKEATRREIAVLDLVLNNHDIRELYGAKMVLVRPDQIIGWRGSDCANPVELWQLLMGQHG